MTTVARLCLYTSRDDASVVVLPLTPEALAPLSPVEDERVWTWSISQDFYRFWNDVEWMELRDAFLRDEPYDELFGVSRREPASWPSQLTRWRVVLVVDGVNYFAEHVGPQRRARVEIRLPDAATVPGLTVCSRVDQTPVRVERLCIKARCAGKVVENEA